MLRALMGRFFRHCIAVAQRADQRRVTVRVFDPDFMTQAEIDTFLLGRAGQLDWRPIEARRRAGHRVPKVRTTPEGQLVLAEALADLQLVNGEQRPVSEALG